jgi:cell division protein FtsL
MIKLLICLLSAVVLGVFVLQLRQQQLELAHQNADLHDKIKAQQAKLWNQQLQIAVFTAPSAIDQTVKGQKIEMVPQFQPQSNHENWLSSDED